MRVTCHFLLLFVCIATARPQNGKPPTPGERYLTQVTATLENAMTPRFGQRLYKMGNAKLTFRLRIARDGRIAEFKASSSTHDEALEQAAIHCLEHVRCPPVPSELLFPSDDALEIQIDMARQE
jgi:outer membrane biosynthesis protein TonB